jgi:hypothetical protein
MRALMRTRECVWGHGHERTRECMWDDGRPFQPIGAWLQRQFDPARLPHIGDDTWDHCRKEGENR